MKIISTETFVGNLESDVYPITILKFLLNKRRILNYFSKVARDDFHIRGLRFLLDQSECMLCKKFEEQQLTCRQHSSLKRILETNSVLFDTDTGLFFYKNEIFRMIKDKLVIFYCPHTKLMEGKITNEKVKKIIPITIQDPELKTLPQYENIKQFSSQELMFQHMKCWFNNELSIVTLPNTTEYSNFCLMPNY